MTHRILTGFKKNVNLNNLSFIYQEIRDTPIKYRNFHKPSTRIFTDSIRQLTRCQNHAKKLTYMYTETVIYK
jgi:hypothetical protein